MQKYVIDTNFFFNLENKSGLGSNSKEVIVALSNLIEALKRAQKAEFFMPPRILDEFLGFVDKDDDYVQGFLALITIKSPESAKVEFPAEIFYTLVDEMRQRSYRGLQVAEEEVHNAGKAMIEQANMSRMDYQKALGEHIKHLRDRYRTATRVKFLDSVADLDLIVLAKELDGIIVTSDEGVVQWGRRFGVKEILPQILKKQLQSLHSA